MKAQTVALTARQRRIVELVGDGLTSRQIAERLNLSVRTVENHRARICDRLQLNGPNALLRAVLQGKLE